LFRSWPDCIIQIEIPPGHFDSPPLIIWHSPPSSPGHRPGGQPGGFKIFFLVSISQIISKTHTTCFFAIVPSAKGFSCVIIPY
jgi:hypothetical protein